MSDWEEAVEDRLADAGYLASAVDEDDDHVTLVEAPVGEVIRIAREALLSEESVERAMLGIHASHDRGDWDEERPEVQDETNESAVARSVQPGIAYDAEKSDAEFIAAARAEWPRMAAALQRVADLHQQETGGTPAGDVADVCSCGTSYWPCPTLQAIEGGDT